MAVGRDKVLGPGGAGVFDADGVLTKHARDRFVDEVIALQTFGNSDGRGLSKVNPLLAPLPPFPPDPGPPVPSIYGPSTLFHFGPEPHAALAIPQVRKEDGVYDALVIKGLYTPLMRMLNQEGSTPLGIVFDPSILIDLDKFPNIVPADLQGILTQLVVLGNLANVPQPAVSIPAKVILFNDFGIVDPPIELIQLLLNPGLPAVPKIEIPGPPVPPLPNPGSPSFFLPELATGILTMPVKIIPDLISSIGTSLPTDPLSFIGDLIKKVFDAILKILEAAGLLLAPLTLLSATLIVMLKNMVAATVCLVLGKLFGTGVLVKFVGFALGLT